MMYVNRRTLGRVLILLALAGLSAGCSNRMAMIEESQIRLEDLGETNAHNISVLKAEFEARQADVQASLKKLDVDVSKLAGDATALRRDNDRDHASLLKATENQAQASIRARDERDALRTALDEVTGRIKKLDTHMAALEREQGVWAQMSKANERTLQVWNTARLAEIETRQETLETELTAARDVSKAAADQLITLEDLQQTAARNRQTLELRIREQQAEIQSLEAALAGAMTTIASVEETLGRQVAAVAAETSRTDPESVAALQQSHEMLVQQLGELQSSTESMMSALRAELDQIKTETANARSSGEE